MMIENEPDPLRRIPVNRPAEIHAEVGAVLRAARLKRGQSLEAVAQQSRIPKRYLDALENDRLDEFPAFVYMRGFLKGYCEHLDVPFDELWARVQPPAGGEAAAPAAPAAKTPAPKPAATPAPRPAPTPTPMAAPTPAPAAHAPVHAHPAHAPAAEHGAHGGDRSLAALAVGGALLVGLAVWIARDRGPAEAPAQPEPPRALQAIPRTVEPKVTLRSLDDAWVRASVDGQVVFEGRLPRGAAMEWKPARTVVLRTTSPAALALTVNGNPAPLPAPNADGDYRIDVP